jgi:hypothetical protein
MYWLAGHQQIQADQIGDEEQIDGEQQSIAGIAGRQPAEQRRDGQQRQEGPGHHPGQIVHTALNGHFIAHGPKDVVPAEEAEEIPEGPGQRPYFLRLRLNEPGN